MRTAQETPSLGITTNTAAAQHEKTTKNAANRTKWQLQRRAQGLLQNERVARCQRGFSSNYRFVHIQRRDDGYTRFSGLLSCGSVWHCPVCAAKITERRRHELQEVITAAVKQGMEVYLVTYTFRHHAGMTLDESIKQFSKALSKMKSRRAYKKIMQRCEADGAVRSLEVTYGDDNGWHPHVHELIFARQGAIAGLESIREEWAKVHKDVFDTTISEAGFDVRNGDYAAEYVAKFGHEPGYASKETAGAGWGVAQELTKGHTKQTKRLAGKTPFALLREYDGGCRRAGRLFCEYADAFKGRRQLFWSKGLREKLGLCDALDDQRVVELEEHEYQDVAVLDHDDWHAVLKHNARYQVLYLAEHGGGIAVRDFVDKLKKRTGKWGGAYTVPRRFTGGEALLYDGM